MKTPVILTVGTTHPLNVAGIGLDLRIAAELGVRLVTVVAGVSAQNASSVLARRAVASDLIRSQFAALADVAVAAIRIGALIDAASIVTVASELGDFADVPIVCDPVLAMTGGDRLSDDAAVAALRDTLFPRCSLVTPNLDEAERFVGEPVRDFAAMEDAGRRLCGRGARAVLVKGGHLVAAPADLLVTAGTIQRFESERIPRSLRGTGDLLACAVAARLAHGDDLVSSIAFGREFVRKRIAAAVAFAGTTTF